MPKIEVLGQRNNQGKMYIRGAFSQKKKVWEAMQQIKDFSDMELVNDVNNKNFPVKYNTMCDILKNNGRVSLINSQGQREFQIIEGEMNHLRNWDVDDEGNILSNPSKNSD